MRGTLRSSLMLIAILAWLPLLGGWGLGEVWAASGEAERVGAGSGAVGSGMVAGAISMAQGLDVESISATGVVKRVDGEPLPLGEKVYEVSARVRGVTRLRKLSRRDYRANEAVALTVDNARAATLKVKVTDRGGKESPVSVVSSVGGRDEEVVLTVRPARTLQPGRYEVEVTDSETGRSWKQDFTWGVLAVNTNKSVYLPLEEAKLAMAVLDETGRMVCDASVRLTITDPGGNVTELTSAKGVTVTAECAKKGFTLLPDYEAMYRVGGVGVYGIRLRAATRNGEYEINDKFEVRSQVDFDIERMTATRIYPPKNYPVKLRVRANQDFEGEIVDVVPEGFGVLPFPGTLPYERVETVATSDTQHEIGDATYLALRHPFDGPYVETLGFGKKIEDGLLAAKYAKFGLVGHDGVDWALPEGTKVVAADGGKIVLAGDGAYGRTVVVEHGWGRSYYGHLSRIDVGKGQRVRKGELLGLSGSTGLSTGPHLHFGIKMAEPDMGNGYYGKVDPMPYLSGEAVTAGQSSVQQVVWKVKMRKGEEVILGYEYDAPNVSPQFYLLGPARMRNLALVVGDRSADGDEVNPFVLGVASGAVEGLNVGALGNVGDGGVRRIAEREIFREVRQWMVAADATFQIQTGYYVGTGADNLAITGIGFQPNFVMIKEDTATGTDGVAFKTSIMSGEVSSVLADPDADTASNAIQSLDSDGFTVGTDTDVNTANERYTWVAVAGSDCTSSGTFCVGSYTGLAIPQSITSVGFQPNVVIVKRSGASNAVWRSSAMSDNEGQYFAASNWITDGSLFTTLDSTGFSIGTHADINSLAVTHYYVAFKSVSTALAVGTYSGNGTDDTNKTGVGFDPDAVWIKASTGAVGAVYNTAESYGDYSSLFTDAASAVNHVQALITDGFQIGNSTAVNTSANSPYYWVAFGGTTAPSASGTFQMATNSYTGSGSAVSISGLGFSPDLVVIKGNGAIDTVYRTGLVAGNNTLYLSSATADFTGGITSLDSDGFSIGTDVKVNASGTGYTWVAFGNAYDPRTNSGAADFAIGQFTGNALDSRDITRVPFQPDLVVIKANGGPRQAALKTSAMTGDLTGWFDATAEEADQVQALNTDGFEVGTQAESNRVNTTMRWFGFKEGSSLDVGTYTGSGVAKDVTSPGFQPDLVWVKRSTAVAGVHKNSSLAGDNTYYFGATANVSDRITGFVSSGFSLGGSQTETNTSGGTYRYAAWVIPASGPTTDQQMRHGSWFNSGVEQSFTF